MESSVVTLFLNVFLIGDVFSIGILSASNCFKTD